MTDRIGRADKKPPWLKIKIPGGERYGRVRRAVADGGLHTVCQSARCPNVGTCWNAGTATFMILGDHCSRGCRFCAVERGTLEGIVDRSEPQRVAAACTRMELDYAVITSVTRDDLEDGGAGLFAETLRAIKRLEPPPLVELLIPDYLGDDLRTVLAAGPEVLAHNVEVVERLTTSMRHRRFSYRRSLEVLAAAASYDRALITKSSIMLGLGERDEEVRATLEDLRAVGVRILVLGQYLRPTPEHAPVVEYVPPARFDELAAVGRDLGFDYVAAGPLVRTSYLAAEAYAKRLHTQSDG